MDNGIKVVIKYDKGIHTRIAAMIVKKCQELMDRYNCTLFIKREKDDTILPGNSLLALISMKIREGETIRVISEGDDNKAAIEFAEFLTGSFVINQHEMDAVDNLIQNNVLASEKIFHSIANGLIVLDDNNIINVFNKAAEKITGISAKDAVGKKADEIIESFKLQEVIETGNEQLGLKQIISDRVVITNRTPIIIDNEVMGAVAVFQDISEIEALSWELNTVKELKTQLENILESVDDGICMIDKNQIITYMNKPFEQMLELENKDKIGNSIFDVLPQDIISITTGKSTHSGCIIKKDDGNEIMLNISPVTIDGDIKGAILISKEMTEIEKLAERVQELSAKAIYLQEELIKKQGLNKPFQNITGKSGPLLEALNIASKAAETNATVLIRGESGTGKELVAKAIHYSSPRKNKPFVRVNCAAIPANLLESELFGHERGAFTGAVKQKIGKFELAEGGTIFLDEIGEMDKGMQVKLLRILQEKEFERVGGIKTHKANVRVIAATNSPLEEQIEKGEFRQDLYYRLNVIPVMMPPLRQRKGDIPILSLHFVEKIAKKHGFPPKKITGSALRCLEDYGWPGNVREMENIIEMAMTLSNDQFIKESDLPKYISGNKENKEYIGFDINIDDDNLPTMEELERLVIEKALRKHKSYRSAGMALGLNHKTIASKAKKYNISY